MSEPVPPSDRFRPVVTDDGSEFRLERLRSHGWLLGALLVLGAVVVVVGVGLLATHTASNAVTGAFFVVAGLFTVRTAFHLNWRPATVRVTDDTLVVRNLLGSVARIRRDAVEGVDLKWRTYGRSAIPIRVPYVRVRHGDGVWIDALAGDRQSRAPDPAQVWIVRHLREVLRVSGVDN